ncbi:ABC transporter permease [uncultured Eudoraea sp.]|uniref:ABC transporter permease n=1 Tax=uncultured Eudoraea sp. TaxID=1035614 RepID=UPI002633ADDA|nr:ABC transporter permease [uncultured Eudoraea sp.]
MSLKRIMISFKMTLLMLLRRRIVLILIAVIPVVFLMIVGLTSTERPLPFRLASLSEETIITVSEKGINYVFFAVSSVGFLLSFLAMNLIQKDKDTTRRLIICGYSPNEIVIAKLATAFVFMLLIATYVGCIMNALYNVNNLFLFLVSLVSIGYVYGCYGLLVGSLIKRELEGILMIVLLVNIDVGWLQNPLFYEEAQNQLIIRYLPAYYPSQSSMISAFTEYSIGHSIALGLLYGSIFLILSLIIYYRTMKVNK